MEPEDISDFAMFIRKCYTDFVFFTEEVLGIKLGAVHKELALLPLKYRYIMIVMPTGHLKTTLFSKAYAIWRLYREENFEIGLVSSSERQAMRILGEVQDILETNPFLMHLVPEDRSISWNKSAIATVNGNKYYTLPFNSTARGYHPNLIIYDDLLRETDIPMEKIKDIFWGVFFPRGQNPTVGSQHIVIGTPQSSDDLYADIEAKAARDKSWYVVRKSAVITDSVGNWIEPLWKEMYSLDYFKQLRDNMGDYRFKREYMCNPLASGSSLYPADLLSYCCDPNLTFSVETKGEVYIGCDFAISTAVTGDYNAYVVVDMIKGDYKRVINIGGIEHEVIVKDPVIIRHIDRYRAASGHAERVKQLFDRYRPVKVICDVSSFGAKIVPEIKQYGIAVEAQEFQRGPRNDLLVGLRRLIETDNPLINPPRLVIPFSQKDNTYSITSILVNEMQSIEESKTKSGITTFSSSAAHDDLVMALAMACKNAFVRRSFLNKVAYTVDELLSKKATPKNI